jgi:hypothetical protein
MTVFLNDSPARTPSDTPHSAESEAGPPRAFSAICVYVLIAAAAGILRAHLAL